MTLDRDLVTLGRGDDNHIVVAEQATSRRHALIQKNEDGTYWIDDLGSSNGTWVNRNRVSGCVVLEDGDEIFVGDTRFVFQIAPEAARRPPAPSDMGLGAPGRTRAGAAE